MKSSRQQLLVPFSAPFLLTLGPQLQGFESVGLILCEKKSAPPTDEGNSRRHMWKKFNTIMANSHLRMASVWNDSFCVYANRTMNMTKTVVLFKENVQRQLLCRVIWYEIIESKQGFFSISAVVGFLEFFPSLASMKHRCLINKQCRAARNDSFHSLYLLLWSI